eukprot:gene12351-16565_t
MNTILLQMDEAFEVRGALVDVGWMTVTEDQPPVVISERHLGIATFIIKPLFKFLLEEFYNLNDSMEKSCDLAYLNGVDLFRLNSISRALLIVKGDFPLAYNLRKSFILLGKLEIADELYLNSIIFTKHPKSPCAWQHRRFCLLHHQRMFLNKIGENNSTKTFLNSSLIETEKELCRKMSELYPKNYYSWLHRIWLLQQMSNFQIVEELEFSENWLNAFVTDHCACNHYIQVIRYVLKNPKIVEEYINQHQPDSLQLILCEKLILHRPGYETLWCLRRGILTIIMEQIKSNFLDLIKKLLNSTYSNGLDYIEQKPFDTESVLNNNGFICSLNRLFKLLVDGSQSSNENEFTNFIQSLLINELNLIKTATNLDYSIYNSQNQYLYAVRYEAFLYEMIIRMDDNDGANKMDTLACADSWRVFFQQSLRKICCILLTKDTFPRMWSHFSRI